MELYITSLFLIAEYYKLAFVPQHFPHCYSFIGNASEGVQCSVLKVPILKILQYLQGTVSRVLVFLKDHVAFNALVKLEQSDLGE